MSSLYAMADTWNNTSNLFTAIQMNVTDTASQSGSLLMDLQVGGVSKFNVRKDGAVTAGSVVTSGNINAGNDINCYTIHNSGAAYFANLLYIGGPGDIGFIRDAAGILAQQVGATAQSLRIYQTFTDTLNYARAALNNTVGQVELAAESAGTGSANIDIKLTPKGAGSVTLPSNIKLSAQFAQIIGAGNSGYINFDSNNGTVSFSKKAGYSNGSGGWSGFQIASDTSLGFAPNAGISAASDAMFWRDGAGIIAQQNGVNPQIFRVYNTFTDTLNYERAKFGWNAGFLEIGTEALGTGSLRNIRFIFGTNVGGFNLGASNVTPIMYVASGTSGKAAGLLTGTGGSVFIYDSTGTLSIAQDTRAAIINGTSIGGTTIWQFQTTGHFVAGADNTYDIGASGNFRPRNLYMASWIKMATSTVAGLPAAATAGAAARMFVTDASAPAFGATVVGGGTILTPVYSDGTNWKVG